MNNRYLILTLSLLAMLVTGCATPRYSTSLDQILIEKGGKRGTHYGYRCTVGAHRGESDVFRENTMAALKAAEINDDYAFIEFDVQYSKDKTIVVFHDRRLLRIFGKLSAVRKKTFKELTALSRGQIAAYKDVMDVLTKPLNIEIKSSRYDEIDRELVDELVNDLRSRGREKDVMISSISPTIIRHVKNRYPDIRTGQVFWLTASTYLPWDSLTKALYDKIRNSRADYLILHVANLRNLEDLLKLKPSDKTVIFWDFDDSAYLVHIDGTDRLWSDSKTKAFFHSLRYSLVSPFEPAGADR